MENGSGDLKEKEGKVNCMTTLFEYRNFQFPEGWKNQGLNGSIHMVLLFSALTIPFLMAYRDFPEYSLAIALLFIIVMIFCINCRRFGPHCNFTVNAYFGMSNENASERLERLFTKEKIEYEKFMNSQCEEQFGNRFRRIRYVFAVKDLPITIHLEDFLLLETAIVMRPVNNKTGKFLEEIVCKIDADLKEYKI